MSNNTKLGVGSLNSNNGSKNTAIGAYASHKNTEGFSNTSLGVNAGFFNETGDFNTSLGSAALCNNLNGSSNTAIGSNALLGTETLSIGNSNTGVGVQSLEENTGDFNTALGAQSGLNLTGGSYNTYLGAKTNASSQDLNHSTAIGYGAKIDDSNQIMMGTANENVQVPGKLNVDGDATFVQNDITVSSGNKNIQIGSGPNDLNNIQIGKGCLNDPRSGNNIAIGFNSLIDPSNGSNIAIGVDTLRYITTSERNTFCGVASGTQITVSNNNTGFGLYTLQNYNGTENDDFNTAIGSHAGRNVMNGTRNTFLGAGTDFDISNAEYRNSTAIGYGAKITDSNQIMMGFPTETVKIPGKLNVDGKSSLQEVQVDGQATFVQNDITVSSGNQNIQIGSGPNDLKNIQIGRGCLSDPSGSNNIAIGFNSLINPDAGNNIAIGADTLRYITTSERNTFCGIASGTQITVSKNNTGFGLYALQNYNGTGDYDDYNTAIGSHAGREVMNGGRNTFLGAGTDFDISNAEYRNSTAVGYAAKITASNQIMMGRANETVQVPGKLNVDGQATFNGPFVGGTTGAEGINTNTVIGKLPSTIFDVSSNHSNVFIGNNILEKYSGRIQNVAIGNGALENGGTNVDKTVAIGYEALKNFRAGDTDPYNNDEPGTSSVAVGYQAGLNCKDCTYCTFLGTGADVDNSGVSYNYSTALGRNAKITHSNQIMMGTAYETVEVPGTLSYQNFRQPIMLSCQIEQTRTEEDATFLGYDYQFKTNYGFFTNDGSDGVIRISEGIIQIQLDIPGIDPSNILATDYTIQVTGIRNIGTEESKDPLYFGVRKQYVNDNNDKVIQIIINNKDGRADLTNDGNIDVNVFYYP